MKITPKRKKLIKLLCEVRDMRTDHIPFTKMQLRTKKLKYKVGDVVELTLGGYGIIKEANRSDSGWPDSYSISKHPKLPFSKAGKVAWYWPLEIWKKVGGIVLNSKL